MQTEHKCGVALTPSIQHHPHSIVVDAAGGKCWFTVTAKIGHLGYRISRIEAYDMAPQAWCLLGESNSSVLSFPIKRRADRLMIKLFGKIMPESRMEGLPLWPPWAIIQCNRSPLSQSCSLP